MKRGEENKQWAQQSKKRTPTVNTPRKVKISEGLVFVLSKGDQEGKKKKKTNLTEENPGNLIRGEVSFGKDRAAAENRTGDPENKKVKWKTRRNCNERKAMWEKT